MLGTTRTWLVCKDCIGIVVNCVARRRNGRSDAYALLEVSELSRCQGIRLADDGDDVDPGAQTLHQLDVNFSQTSAARELLGNDY